MKKTVLSLVLVATLSTVVAQDILHINGVKNIYAGGGYHLGGYSVDGGFEYYFGPRFSLISFLEYEHTTLKYTATKIIASKIDANYTLVSLKEKMFFNLSAGIGGGYGHYNSRVEAVNDSEFIYNVSVGANYEVLLLKRLGFLIKYNQLVYNSSSLGLNNKLVVGIKFYFY